MSLDSEYGAAVAAARVDDVEKFHIPASLFIVDATSAPSLRDFMKSIADGCLVGAFLERCATLLWLVDKQGRLILAVEERVDVSEPDQRVPNMHLLSYAEKWRKLGHPSLVRGDSARIGGELYFDDSLEEPEWVLTNKSGRYGLRNLGRHPRQLANVAGIFSQHGINVRPSMID